MSKSFFIQSVIYTFIAMLIAIAVLNVSFAQVRTSSNYQLQSDSINVGGGFSSSTSYVQESTVGEVATGPSDSSTYSLRAGYQQMQEVFISLASTGDVTMSPSLPGLTGGTSNGSTTLTVTTDSPSGYQLTIQAENDPAMQRDGGGSSIPDYDPGVNPSFTFIIAANEARFGFNAAGTDATQAFLENAGVCNTGVSSTPLSCWDGLSTSPYKIAEGIGANHPSGMDTIVNFRVRVGSSAGVIAGVYTATTTVTALPL